MSTLISKASLLLVPSVYEDGTLYNVLPSGNKAPDETGNHNAYDQTRADFTFSRGSNLTATRVNASGLIEKGRENLLLQSNTFSQSWVNTRSSESSGFEGYDGTNNAWKLKEDNNNGTHKIVQSITQTGVVTASLYAKAGERSAVQFIIESGGSYAGVNFDLTDGSVQSSPAATFTLIDSNSIDVGNGWYRLIFAANITSSASFSIYTLNSSFSTSYQGTTGEGVYIQNAQLEYGLTASSYLDSGATTATAGVLENTPRIDYSSGAGALLLEPQRTNIFTQSEFATLALVSNVNRTNNYTTSPEGVSNGTRLQFTANGFVGNNTQTNGTQYTLSCYAKRNDSGTQDVGFFQDGTGYVNSSWSLTSDWQRFTYTYTAANASYAGIAGISGADVSVYGFQMEAGSYATSYIPTYGSAATRGADDMDTTFATAITTNGSATIFFHELGLADSDDITSAGGDYRYQKDGSNYVSLTSEITNWRIRIQSGGSSNFKGLTGYAKTSPIKVAIIVTSTTYSIYANGSAVVENEALSATADFSSIENFTSIISENVGVRKSKQHIVFGEALSSAECVTLTTL